MKTEMMSASYRTASLTQPRTCQHQAVHGRRQNALVKDDVAAASSAVRRADAMLVLAGSQSLVVAGIAISGGSAQALKRRWRRGGCVLLKWSKTVRCNVWRARRQGVSVLDAQSNLAAYLTAHCSFCVLCVVTIHVRA